MVSFIVIGKNEELNIKNCIDSIYKTIAYSRINNYEIIYVDSKSTDNSVLSVKEFKETKIYLLTGDTNAAIARNVGAKESCGDILFFVDGDMELIPEFIKKVYENNQLIHPFISGNLINYFYDKESKLVEKQNYYNLSQDTCKGTGGGVFLINRGVWNKAKGMRVFFRIGEDLDLGYRLNKKNIKFCRKKDSIAIHHTSVISNFQKWENLLNGNELFGRSFLYRKNIWNKYIHYRFFRSEYSLVLLLISMVSFFLFNYWELILPYILILILKAIKLSRIDIINILNDCLYFIVRDISTFFGLFLFFPKQDINVKYIKLKG